MSLHYISYKSMVYCYDFVLTCSEVKFVNKWACQVSDDSTTWTYAPVCSIKSLKNTLMQNIQIYYKIYRHVKWPDSMPLLLKQTWVENVVVPGFLDIIWYCYW